MSKSILKQREPNITQAREYDDTSQEDLKTVEVESVQIGGQSKKQVVKNGANGGSCDTICVMVKRLKAVNDEKDSQ